MRLAWITVGCTLAMMLPGSAGCRDKAKEMSTASHQLSELHDAWTAARAAIQAGNADNLWQVASVDLLLGGPTRRRVELEYAAANKAEVLKKLDSLGAAYRQEIMAKLSTSGHKVVLRNGVSMEDLRTAFTRLDPEYQSLHSMVAGP